MPYVKLVVLSLLVVAGIISADNARAAAPALIFSERLSSPGWVDASWGASINYAANNTAWGRRAIEVDVTQSWGAVSWKTVVGGYSAATAPGKINALTFTVAVQAADLGVYLELRNAAGAKVFDRSLTSLLNTSTLLPGLWYTVVVKLADVSGDVARVSLKSQYVGRFVVDGVAFAWQSTYAALSQGQTGAGWSERTSLAARDTRYYEGRIATRVSPSGTGATYRFDRSAGIAPMKDQFIHAWTHGGNFAGHVVWLNVFARTASGVVKTGTIRVRTTDNAWIEVRAPMAVLNPTLAPVVSIEFVSDTMLPFLIDDVSISGDTPRWAFPVANYTSSTAPISSVFDHDMAQAYETTETRTVQGFSGPVADGASPYSDKTCVAQQTGLPFVLPGAQYVGANSCGGKLTLSYDAHPGIDYAFPDDTPVYAVADGVVVGEPNGAMECPSDGTACGGNGRLRVRGYSGIEAWYLHLSKQAKGSAGKYLKIGDVVKAGDRIAFSGHTNTTSAHLHIEARKIDGSTNGTPVDPYGWTGIGVDAQTILQPGVVSRRFWLQ